MSVRIAAWSFAKRKANHTFREKIRFREKNDYIDYISFIGLKVIDISI